MEWQQKNRKSRDDEETKELRMGLESAEQYIEQLQWQQKESERETRRK